MYPNPNARMTSVNTVMMTGFQAVLNAGVIRRAHQSDAFESMHV
jgi:hypothetical protein